jgi:glucose/arabinose dehydrogenase
LTYDDAFVSGLVNPWDIAFLPGATGPEGAMLYTENNAGTISIYNSPGVTDELAAIAGFDPAGEGGAMGLAVDPAYPAQPYVYVCYSTATDNRVGKFTLSGTPPTSATLLQDIIVGMPHSTAHNGCRVRFQPNTSPPALWVTMGDAVSGPNPQNPSSLGGKILRVQTDGTAYPGNVSGQRWYSRGHRNPQGIGFRPSTNAPYTSEHGPNINDEVNLLANGGNGGWDPNTNGAYDQAHPMTDLAKFPDALLPVWRSGDQFTVAPSGMTFLDGPEWKSWDGAIIVALLNFRHLRALFLNGAGTSSMQVFPVDGSDQSTRLRVPVEGPDGKLYVATDESAGAIWQITPS